MRFLAIRFIVLVILNINTEGIKSRKIKFLTITDRDSTYGHGVLLNKIYTIHELKLYQNHQPLFWNYLHIIFDNMEFQNK